MTDTTAKLGGTPGPLVLRDEGSWFDETMEMLDVVAWLDAATQVIVMLPTEALGDDAEGDVDDDEEEEEGFSLYTMAREADEVWPGEVLTMLQGAPNGTLLRRVAEA